MDLGAGEFDAVRFDPEKDEDRKGHGDDRGDGRERESVVSAIGFRNSRLQSGVRRGQQIAKLIGEAGKRPAHVLGGKFVEVRRDNAPGSLNGELHEEGANRHCYRARAISPNRNERESEKRRERNRPAAADPLRERAKQESSKDCANIIDDRDQADRMLREMTLSCRNAG